MRITNKIQEIEEMKDFQLRNDTRLQFCVNPAERLQLIARGKRVLFVYGGGSVKRNGCLEDVRNAVSGSGGNLYEFGNASRERSDIERGICMAKELQVEMVIGAGGANVMDCAKLISFGVCHEEEWWEFVKGRKKPYMGLEQLWPIPGPVILAQPTESLLMMQFLSPDILYPSAGR